RGRMPNEVWSEKLLERGQVALRKDLDIVAPHQAIVLLTRHLGPPLVASRHTPSQMLGLWVRRKSARRLTHTNDQPTAHVASYRAARFFCKSARIISHCGARNLANGTGARGSKAR